MGNVIVIDEPVFDSLNRGDEKIAQRIRQLWDSGAQFWVTAETYNRLKTVNANRELLKDLRVQAPLQDEYYLRKEMANRRQLRLGQTYDPSNSTTMVKDSNNKFKEKKMTSDEYHRWHSQWGGFTQRQLTAAALVYHVQGELLTTDKQFQQAFKHISGPVREVQHQTVNSKTPVDYNRTRRLLGFDNKNFTGVGSNAPRKLKINKAPPAPVVNGERVKPGRGEFVGGDNYPGKRGEKVNTVRVTRGVPTGPDIKVNVRDDGRRVQMYFRGANWVIQKLNGSIQQQKVDEAMSKIRKSIEDRLDANPTLGAVIVTFYTRPQKVGQDNDSVMTHTHSFSGIGVGYGRTEEEALKDLGSRPALREVNSPPGRPLDLESEKQWIAPAKPLPFAELPTPFAKWGLATFYPGREEVTNIKWSQALGFDDMWMSSTSVPVSANPGNRVTFHILIPPAEVAYRDGNRVKRKDVPQSLSRVGMVADHELSHLYAPCLDLDSWANFSDTVACMVYPADKYSKHILEQTPRLNHSQLIDDFNLIRFVKPSKILLFDSIMAVRIPSS